jgi:hypothetical protein
MCLSHLIYTVRPCLIHTCHAMPMPCSDHAVLLKTTAQQVRRETAFGLPGRVQLLPATMWSSTKVVSTAYQSQMQVTSVKPNRTRKRVIAAQYKKDNMLKWRTSTSDISGYHVDFHEGHSTFGAWQGRGMACVN